MGSRRELLTERDSALNKRKTLSAQVTPIRLYFLKTSYLSLYDISMPREATSSRLYSSPGMHWNARLISTFDVGR